MFCSRVTGTEWLGCSEGLLGCNGRRANNDVDDGDDEDDDDGDVGELKRWRWVRFGTGNSWGFGDRSVVGRLPD